MFYSSRENIIRFSLPYKNRFVRLLTKILFVFRGGKGDKKREVNIDVQEKCQLVASPTAPTGDLVHNPGTCSDQESNWQSFSLWDDVQPMSHTSQGYQGFQKENQNYLLIIIIQEDKNSNTHRRQRGEQNNKLCKQPCIGSNNREESQKGQHYILNSSSITLPFL